MYEEVGEIFMLNSLLPYLPTLFAIFVQMLRGEMVAGGGVQCWDRNGQQQCRVPSQL